MKYHSIFLSMTLVFSLALLGSQCQQSVETISLEERNTDWQQIATDVEFRSFPVTVNEQVIEFLAYRFEPETMIASIVHETTPKRFDFWQEQLNGTIMINGAFFSESYEPTGALYINGAKIGTNTYSGATSATFLVQNGIPQITTKSLDTISISETTSLVQSFPILINNGESTIQEESNKIARRTILAQDVEGHFFIILVDQTPTSLYQVSQALIQSDLHLSLALNLDGGPSTGVYASLNDHELRRIPLTPLPQVLVFSKRLQD